MNKTDCFRNEIVYSEIDLQRIKFEKKLKNVQRNSEDSIKKPCYFYINQVYTEITRKIDKFPFIPIDFRRFERKTWTRISLRIIKR